MENLRRKIGGFFSRRFKWPKSPSFLDAGSEPRGVVLLLVVLILSIILSISIGIFGVVYSETKISGEIGNSFNAFYLSDEAMERILYEDRVADWASGLEPAPGCPGTGVCSWDSDNVDLSTADPTKWPSGPRGGCLRIIYDRKGSGDVSAITVGDYPCGSPLVVKRAGESLYNKGGGGGWVIFDDFTDRNYTVNPAWTVVNGGWDATSRFLENAANYSEIRVPSTKAYGEWSVDIRQRDEDWYTIFAIINTNGRIYGRGLSGGRSYGNEGSGYDILVGSGPAIGDMGVGLYLEDGRGTSGVYATPIIPFTRVGPIDSNWHTVRVTRSAANEFSLYYDGVLVGSVTDATYITSSYMGVYANTLVDGRSNVDNILIK